MDNSNQNNINEGIIEEDFDNEKNEICQDKINKPIELKEFDALPHFKSNIINSDKNCKEEINEYSYYCFTCKHSVCGECGIYEHRDHLLIQRENCLNYDNTFFNEISKVIDDAISIQNKKDKIILIISDCIKSLKNKLDEIKNKKIEEVNKLFIDISNNLIELKKNYLNAKSAIEKYYQKNKTFFNILGPNNPNLDIENTVFLMNFEIMNLCDNKNLEVLDNIIQIKTKLNNYENAIKEKKNQMENQLEHFLDIEYSFEKFDDFYWDIKLRTTKYSEHIKQFKKTISEIIKKTGNFDRIRELLDIFDSKNKKGKDVIFNQEYFINNTTEKDISIHKQKKIRGNSKNKLKTSKSGNLFKSNVNYNSGINKMYSNNNTIGNINHSFNQLNPNDIILDNEMIERFFAFTILELYSKFFDNKSYKHIQYMDNLLENNKNINNKNINDKNINDKNINDKIKNINEKNKNEKIINKNEKNKNEKSQIKHNMKKSNSKNNVFINNNNNEHTLTQNNENNLLKSSKIIQNINQITVNYLNNYTTRYNILKEYVKPIIGTNQISVFDSNTQKIKKITLKLIKEEHDYNIFPDGCRHILIDDILYVTGGVSIEKQFNTVLSFNIITFEIKKLNYLNYPHSYHSIEYLDNFDCLIVIGGELNCICELFDIYSQKWIQIPNLKSPKANANIYFDNVTSDLYALFGMEGNIIETKNNSDSIEVLELNDIKSGWIKVDYYKSADLDLKQNYCTVLPFTRNKLLIYGGNDSRVTKKLFALFDMSKNECVKVDTKTLELIKLEEKQMKMIDQELSKIN